MEDDRQARGSAAPHPPGDATGVVRHTPAPWTLDREGLSGLFEPGYHYITAGKGFPEDKANGPGFELSGCMSLADARLIATAPEMFQEIGRMISILENAIPRLQSVHALLARELEMDLMRLRSVLSKAGG